MPKPTKLNQYKQMVEYVLQEYPKARDDDLTMTILVWQEFYGVGSTVEVEKLHQLPRELTLVKLRQTVQNKEKKFLPTDLAVARKRGIEEQDWRWYVKRHNIKIDKEAKSHELFSVEGMVAKPKLGS